MNNKSFVGSIDSEFEVNFNESVFDTLLRQYGEVIFKSIITSFGLDSFIKDIYGGDVDTILNVRKVGIDPNMTYKNASNEAAYDNRGEYDSIVYHKDDRYREKVHSARKNFDNTGEKVADAYVVGNDLIPRRNKSIPRNEQAQLDHVQSANEIHNDAGRVLSGLDGIDLASRDENLRFTNAALNNNMRDKSVEEYIQWCEENPDKVNWNGTKGEPLSEEVKAKLREEYARAKTDYDTRLTKSYYLDWSNPACRQFYKDTTIAARKRGIEMGLRQALGFMITELVFSVKDEIAMSDGTVSGVINAIIKGLKNGMIRIKNDYKQIFAQFGEGLISGILASITTTLVNTFFTTSQHLGRVLRQAWASVVEAVSIIFLDSSQPYFCDRITSATKVLATGASMIIGTSVQDAVQTSLTEVPIPKSLKEIISTFAGSMASGFLAVTLLFYIDNDPFDKFFDQVYGVGLENLKSQGKLFKQYCAKLQSIDYERLEQETSYVVALTIRLQSADSQTAINALLISASEDLNLPSIFGDRTRDECMQDKNWVFTF